jgi:pimeloyl-ACP methyl ester carboxylesterase
MNQQAIHRHLLSCDHGYVHYRHAGDPEAPKVLLLHQAPQSSRSLIDLISFLSDSYCVVAPDMPGFGLSDALPNLAPNIQDYAAALQAFIAQIHHQDCAIYGLHTGAAIAAVMATQYAYRNLALDGLPKFSDAERADFLEHFFPDFSPLADGTHLTKLWQRMSDQFVYFPWFKKTNPILRKIQVTAERVQSAVDDVLMTGGSCWLGYRAAITFDAESALHKLKGPATLLFREEDLIADHQYRFGTLPSSINVRRFSSNAHWEEIRMSLAGLASQ